MVGDPLHFLIIDDNPDGRDLLVRTLRRKYPNAQIQDVAAPHIAINFARIRAWDVIVAHRAGEMDGESLIRELRTAAPTTAILGVSGMDRAVGMKAAGANAFLNYDAWLLLGNAVEELVARAADRPD